MSRRFCDVCVGKSRADQKKCTPCKGTGQLQWGDSICLPCSGSGKRKDAPIFNCICCEGTGLLPFGFRYCEQCSGSGRLKDSTVVLCVGCSGKGKLKGVASPNSPGNPYASQQPLPPPKAQTPPRSSAPQPKPVHRIAYTAKQQPAQQQQQTPAAPSGLHLQGVDLSGLDVHAAATAVIQAAWKELKPATAEVPGSAPLDPIPLFCSQGVSESATSTPTSGITHAPPTPPSATPCAHQKDSVPNDGAKENTTEEKLFPNFQLAQQNKVAAHTNTHTERRKTYVVIPLLHALPGRAHVARWAARRSESVCVFLNGECVGK